MKKLIFSISALLLSTGMAMAQKAIMYSSTDNTKWISSKCSITKEPTTQADYIVYTDSLLQDIKGLGGTFSERGWDAMQALTPEQRLNLMKEFFGSNDIHFA